MNHARSSYSLAMVLDLPMSIELLLRPLIGSIFTRLCITIDGPYRQRSSIQGFCHPSLTSASLQRVHHPRSLFVCILNRDTISCFPEKVVTMASLIAILDLKGKPLIQRSYRDDVPPSYIERFLPLILELEEQDKQVTPCFTDQGINYMHIRHSNLYCTL
jgi:hypothetical protein